MAKKVSIAFYGLYRHFAEYGYKRLCLRRKERERVQSTSIFVHIIHSIFIYLLTILSPTA